MFQDSCDSNNSNGNGLAAINMHLMLLLIPQYKMVTVQFWSDLQTLIYLLCSDGISVAVTG